MEGLASIKHRDFNCVYVVLIYWNLDVLVLSDRPFLWWKVFFMAGWNKFSVGFRDSRQLFRPLYIEKYSVIWDAELTTVYILQLILNFSQTDRILKRIIVADYEWIESRAFSWFILFDNVLISLILGVLITLEDEACTTSNYLNRIFTNTFSIQCARNDRNLVVASQCVTLPNESDTKLVIENLQGFMNKKRTGFYKRDEWNLDLEFKSCV